ncbi:MAG: type II toxin-antitoxin system VapC family toxin [Proteobacteria bacterium]|nr:type II toxin-antitoxin system VapC family toxin [Pseudomonadota bacterium]MBU1716000.1 type II toxin-antitoxin system VapC family toxin [Pseudomonadota bacterium]
MIVVLDASAAIEVVLHRDSAEKLSKQLVEADWVIAPTLFISEVANTVWKYQKFADLPFQLCEKALEQALALPDDYINEYDLFREAFKLSCTLDHPVYDMLYLVTARRNNAILLTLDKKLRQIAIKCSVEINGN